MDAQIEPLQLLNVTKTSPETNNNNTITQVAQGSMSTFLQTISMDEIDSTTDTHFIRGDLLQKEISLI